MKTTDLTTPISSTKLNENMYKKFGVKVKFENYSREQLEDYRNLLRTKLHQHEAKSNFNDLLTNEAYQKDKALVNLLNQKIKEMLGESKAREGNAFGKAVRDAKADGVQKGEKVKEEEEPAITKKGDQSGI
jgi:predicted transposase YdaD